jgi:Arc/MetJ-type ribon-helix-helix transcriptional regulator
MAKSVVVKKKLRGRPATVRDPLVGTRLPESLLAEIGRWSQRNEVASRSEAIRRLIETGLQFDGQKRSFDVSRGARAEELAGAQINKMGDASATGEERTKRKRRLTRGPSEFREGRVDQPRKRRFK